MAEGGSGQGAGSAVSGSAGKGQFLRDILKEDERETVVSSSDVTGRSKATSKSTKLIFPRLDDTRQTLFSPTPGQMAVHLPDINVSQLNTAFNNSIADGGQSAKDKAEKEAASSIAEKELEILEKQQKALERGTISSGSGSTNEHRFRKTVEKIMVEKKDLKMLNKYNKEHAKARQSKFKKRLTIAAKSGASKSDLDVRRSKSPTPGRRRKVSSSREYYSDVEFDRLQSRATRRSRQGSSRVSSKASTPKKTRSKNDDYDSDEDTESDPAPKKKKKRGKGEKNRWMGWDTGRLAPHKLNKLPQFADLAGQIREWINNYVLKQKSYPSRPLPLCERESQHYVRDYLTFKSINEMFELMTTAVLLRRPDRPLDFLIEFTRTMGGQLRHSQIYRPCCAQEGESELSEANRECHAPRLPHHLPGLPRLTKPPELLPGRPGDLGATLTPRHIPDIIQSSSSKNIHIV